MLVSSLPLSSDTMASQHNLQITIKDKIFEDWNVLPQDEQLVSSVDDTDSFVDFNDSKFNVIKTEECDESAASPEPLCCASLNAPTCQGLGKRQEVSLPEFRVPHDMLMVKKLLHLTLPKKHGCSRWTKQTTGSILTFLKSFVTIARGSRLSHSADRCLALRGPRILKCEECFLEFSGSYDRYLKLFIHYKAAHRLKCNMLIGRKWMKQMTPLDIMVQAWRMDLSYELCNFLSPTQKSLKVSRRRNCK